MCIKPELSKFFRRDDTADHLIVAPLSAGEAVALADAETARCEVDGRIARHRQKSCKRSPTCRRFTLAIRKADDAGQSLHVPADCGRFDCPACLRRWRIRQLGRVADRLATAEAVSTAPRQGNLHAWTGPAERWDSLSKAIRRRAPGCGHAKMARADGTCTVIAEAAFPGSVPVCVPVAVSLACDAVENAMPAMHAVRWLGAWAVKSRAKEWEIVRHAKSLSEVAALAVQLGGSVEDAKGRLAVRFADAVRPDTVAEFWSRLGVCPSPSFLEESLKRLELDSPPAGPTLDTSPPLDSGQVPLVA